MSVQTHEEYCPNCEREREHYVTLGIVDSPTDGSEKRVGRYPRRVAECVVCEYQKQVNHTGRDSWTGGSA